MTHSNRLQWGVVICWLCAIGEALPAMAADYGCTVVIQEDTPLYYSYYLVSTDQERQSLAQTGYPGSFTLCVTARLLKDQVSEELLRHLTVQFTDARVRTVSDDKELREWEYLWPSSAYYQRISGKRPSTFLDSGGDGFFDCLRRDEVRSYIRLKSQLIEVINNRDMPDKVAVQADSTLPRYGQDMSERPVIEVYGFVDGRWVVTRRGGKPVNWKLDPSDATSLVFPRIPVPPMPENSQLQPSAIEGWTQTELKGCRFSHYPLDKQIVDRSGRFLKLTTHFGQGIEVHLSPEGKVLDWQLDDVCQERLSYDRQGRLHARSFRVGDFCYLDADGDGVFESVHDEKRQVWFLIRIADLLKVGAPNRESEFPVEFPDVANSKVRYRLVNHAWQAAESE